MSWDKYNEARKKAKEAEKKIEELSKAVSVGNKKVTKSSTTKSSSSTKKSTSSKKTNISVTGSSSMSSSDIKTAYKNAKSNRWLFVIFAILSAIMLVSLVFTSTIEPVVNSWFNTYTSKSADDADNGYVKTVTDVIANSQLKVHYVNVGQGDCILIDLPDGKNIVIDSGTSTYDSEISKKVINYIDKILLKDDEIIDYMILTHPDADHMNYMPDILDNFEVANIYRPYVFYCSNNKDSESGTIAEKQAVAQQEILTVNYLNSTYNYGITLGDVDANATNVKNTEVMYKFVSRIYKETYGDSKLCQIRFPITGEKIIGTGYSLTFYAPITPSKMYSSWNNYSSVMVLEYNDTKLAFTGDAEKTEENEILANQNEYSLPDVDIMDMGHHGSYTSSQDSYVKALSPEYAIISCGEYSIYKHPSQQTLDTLHNNGVDENHIFMTIQSGDIVIGVNYVAPDTSETKKFFIAYSGDKDYVAPASIYIEWWQVVVTCIILFALVLLVIIPKIIKKAKKVTKNFKS